MAKPQENRVHLLAAIRKLEPQLKEFAQQFGVKELGSLVADVCRGRGYMQANDDHAAE